jgi:parallel beta-helix repeat protein
MKNDVLKKIMLISLLLFFPLHLYAQTPGDVNQDSLVDIIDALLTAQYYVGLAPQGVSVAAMDVDCDGDQDIVDALLIAQFYVGLIEEFPCAGSSITVPGDYSTILEAIDASADGTTIVLADYVFQGQGNKNLNWAGDEKHLTITSENGPGNCIIDCEEDGRAFVLNNGQTRADVIDGITIINGWIRTNSPSLTGGGAILCDGTSPKIINCIIRNNVAGDKVNSLSQSYYADGGAIDCVNESSPYIYNNIIENNYANHTGGGIHFGDTSGGVLANNQIINNINRGCYGGGGIALVYMSHPRIVNNLIAYNQTEYYDEGGYGGGIICLNSDPEIINNTIVHNSCVTSLSDGEGGGIRVRGKPYPIIVNSIIRDNLAGPGLENIDFQYPEEKLEIRNSNIGGGIGSILTDYPETIIDLDPGFIDPDNDNFDLIAGSSSIDNGYSSALTPEDMYDLGGRSRISGEAVDLGAFEYQFD